MGKPRYFTIADLDEINYWYRLRDLQPVDDSLIPNIGFIVPKVAAGFLYKTDSAVCLFDGYITNPQSDKTTRDKALDAITAELISAAKDYGFQSTLAFTKVDAIKKRCEKLNFKAKPEYSLYMRALIN